MFKAQLEKKVALVTGAGRGIGLAYARAFCDAGSTVVLADIQSDLVKNAAESLGSGAIPMTVDVSNEQSVAKLFAEVDHRFGKLDLLINNAAIMLDVAKPFKPFWEIDLTEWERIFAVNTRGVFLCCKEARPLMFKAGRGRIVNITSDAIWHGYAGQMAYFASKGAVAVMTRCLARELGEFHINVNSVAPGLTSSESVNQSTFLQGLKGEIIKSRALQRDQVPEDLVQTVLFLCTEASDAITGQTIVINSGGIML